MLFRSGREGKRIIGHFTGMGVVPQLVHELSEKGIHVPPSMFQRAPEEG